METYAKTNNTQKTWNCMVEYTIDPKSRIQIGKDIPIDNIILSILFDKFFSNIMVCISFDTQTLQVFQEGDLKEVVSENIHKRKI
jgi:poly(A) polymerase Pap1